MGRAAPVRIRLLQKGRDDCERGDGSGFSAENAGAEGHGAPAIGVEESFFRGRPPAFGADGDFERGHLRLGSGLRFVEADQAVVVEIDPGPVRGAWSVPARVENVSPLRKTVRDCVATSVRNCVDGLTVSAVQSGPL